MARSRKTPVETPETAELSTEDQVAADAALAAALDLQNQPVHRAPAKQKASLGDNFVSVAAMFRDVRQQTRLSEATLVKIWEFTLMWALNNKETTDMGSIFPEDEGDGSEGDESLPVPNEVLGADDSADTTEE